jgi:hypothetical protein
LLRQLANSTAAALAAINQGDSLYKKIVQEFDATNQPVTAVFALRESKKKLHYWTQGTATNKANFLCEKASLPAGVTVDSSGAKVTLAAWTCSWDKPSIAADADAATIKRVTAEIAVWDASLAAQKAIDATLTKPVVTVYC